ncbi:hypothetical protein HELRODRAFT_147435, partial [Helobdella robusta]|uniref:Spondin domain-containing protein n=1 Tax=Helobdella robusta TaxID=6412 RepID=T1EK05_HELRO
HPTPSCCSCESAKYQMTFSSLWSNQAHPEFFFQGRLQLVTMKWSNIVGSTHSSKYIMWQYGREVSDGMVHLCK